VQEDGLKLTIFPGYVYGKDDTKGLVNTLSMMGVIVKLPRPVHAGVPGNFG